MDGIAVRPSLIEPGVFDDGINDAQALWGAYAVGRSPAWLPFGSRSTSTISATRMRRRASTRARRRKPATRWASGSGASGRDGTGTGSSCTSSARFGRGDIRAWSVASETGYTARDAPLVAAPGPLGQRRQRRPQPGRPRPARPSTRCSHAATTSPNWRCSARAISSTSIPRSPSNPTERLSLTADVDFFWRLEHGDGIYSPSGRLLRSGRGSDARYVSTEFSLNATWQIDTNMSLTGIYAHSFPGAFVKHTGPAKDIDYVEFTLKIRF